MVIFLQLANKQQNARKPETERKFTEFVADLNGVGIFKKMFPLSHNGPNPQFPRERIISLKNDIFTAPQCTASQIGEKTGLVGGSDIKEPPEGMIKDIVQDNLNSVGKNECLTIYCETK